MAQVIPAQEGICLTSFILSLLIKAWQLRHECRKNEDLCQSCFIGKIGTEIELALLFLIISQSNLLSTGAWAVYTCGVGYLKFKLILSLRLPAPRFNMRTVRHPFQSNLIPHPSLQRFGILYIAWRSVGTQEECWPLILKQSDRIRNWSECICAAWWHIQWVGDSWITARRFIWLYECDESTWIGLYRNLKHSVNPWKSGR